MCFKLTLSSPDRHFDKSYKIANDYNEVGHYIIFHEKAGCELFNETSGPERNISRAYMDPYPAENVSRCESHITGAPLSYFPKSCFRSKKKYHRDEENLDVYMKEIIRAVSYVYDTVALLEELHEIELLMQAIITFNSKVDIDRLSEKDNVSLL